jgi:hypothetical protein
MSNSRTFQINGQTFTLSSPAPEIGPLHLALAQTLMEMAVERGTDQLEFSLQEIAQRLVAKGYDPETGEGEN